MMLVGTLVTPQATTHSAALEQVAPKGTATEAFGWVVTAVTVGLAIGQSISGYLVEHVGTPSAFLAAGGSGLLIAALVFVFRGTVAAGAPDGGDGDSLVGSRAEMDLAAR
jgi:MFS family permease